MPKKINSLEQKDKKRNLEIRLKEVEIEINDSKIRLKQIHGKK